MEPLHIVEQSRRNWNIVKGEVLVWASHGVSKRKTADNDSSKQNCYSAKVGYLLSQYQTVGGWNGWVLASTTTVSSDYGMFNISKESACSLKWLQLWNTIVVQFNTSLALFHFWNLYRKNGNGCNFRVPFCVPQVATTNSYHWIELERFLLVYNTEDWWWLEPVLFKRNFEPPESLLLAAAMWEWGLRKQAKVLFMILPCD